MDKDFETYNEISEYLQQEKGNLTDEQRENFQFFIDDFERRYLSPRFNDKKEELYKIMRQQNKPRPKSEGKGIIKKPQSQITRGGSVKQTNQKEKKKKTKYIQHYKKFRPKQRPDIVYQDRIFRYKTQLVNGPQLACAFNKTWHPKISCKMYLNLGKNAYKKISKNPDLIPQFIEDGYINVKNKHSEEEEQYMITLKENGEEIRKVNKRKQGPKALETDSEEDLEEAELQNIDRRKKIRLMEEEKDEEDEEENDTLEQDENEPRALEPEEDTTEDELDNKRPTFRTNRFNPVSSLKKVKKSTRVRFEERAREELEEDEIPNKKKMVAANKRSKSEPKKQSKKGQKKGQKKQSKKQAKKPIALKKNKMLEEDQDTDEEDDS